MDGKSLHFPEILLVEIEIDPVYSGPENHTARVHKPHN
jgi:hypothetical protein